MPLAEGFGEAEPPQIKKYYRNHMATIELDHISKRYEGREVLSDLSLTIEHGECFTLLGPSGCGKTVLMRLIAGFEVPEQGTIRIGDTVVVDAQKHIDLSPDTRDLGVVFQEYAVWPHMTVFDNVAYPLKLAKTPPPELEKRVLETIALVNMTGLERRLPSELSGGQQQRVALARALVANPSLMLLDEPLSNLDANLREEMRFEIKEMQRKLDITVLYVTHDQEIALALSDRIAVMDKNGKILQVGTPFDIFEKPASLAVFTFMGVANFMAVREENGEFYVGTGSQPVPWEKPQGTANNWVAGFRPSDVMISRKKDGLRGVVKRANFLGAMMDYLVEVDGTEFRTGVETHLAVEAGLMFAEGEECSLEFASLHWFDAAEMVEEA